MVGFEDPEGLVCFCYGCVVPNHLQVAGRAFAERGAGEVAGVEFGLCGHFGDMEFR